MDLKSTLKKSQTITGLVRDFRSIASSYRHKRHNAVIRNYLAQAREPCLHIGAGRATLSGWLSTDLVPADSSTVYLDATKPFPMPDNSFDYIYCEHMIEHVSREDALQMLRESRRVLKPTGVMRVATPDLPFILSLYDNPSNEGKKYMEWITATFLPNQAEAKAVFVINNAFRAWGHQFLYDAETLELSFREAGFGEFVRERYNESRHAALRNIESHGSGIGNEPMVICETLLYEASGFSTPT